MSIHEFHSLLTSGADVSSLVRLLRKLGERLDLTVLLEEPTQWIPWEGGGYASHGMVATPS